MKLHTVLQCAHSLSCERMWLAEPTDLPHIRQKGSQRLSCKIMFTSDLESAQKPPRQSQTASKIITCSASKVPINLHYGPKLLKNAHYAATLQISLHYPPKMLINLHYVPKLIVTLHYGAKLLMNLHWSQTINQYNQSSHNC